jgi:hypothetical protein
MAQDQPPSHDLMLLTQWNVDQAWRILSAIRKSIADSDRVVKKTRRKIAESDAVIARIKNALNGSRFSNS